MELARYNGSRFETFDDSLLDLKLTTSLPEQVDQQSDDSFDLPEPTPEILAKVEENMRKHDPHYVCLQGYVSRVTDTTFDLSVEESSDSWSLIHVDSTELTLKFRNTLAG